MSRRELPIFPLSTVLYPQGPLPLRIFEPRYVDMVRRCMKADLGFVVALLVEGREAGAAGGAVTAAVGTEARIVDFDQLEDGLLGLTCIGQQRVRIHRAWQQPDGLNVGEVEDLPADPVVPVPTDCLELRMALEKAWPELDGPYVHVPARFDDAGWVANRLAELAPLDTLIRQTLLEASDPEERLRVLVPIIRVREH